jgi:antitoxin (DNA-binding transcriptional repressor) of toxin-antitoxin stability system
MTEFRDNLSAYLDAAESGKTITITRRGRPSATLAAARGVLEAINLVELKAFRESLGVRVKESVIVEARRDERY